MKKLWQISMILLILAACFTAVSCTQKTAQTGLLQGGVTIGAITPVEQPGQTIIVPPEVFSSRKVLVYGPNGAKLVQEVTINQIRQTANGYYSVQLEPGTYSIDITHTGIGGSSGLPQNITITAGQTTILNIDIDTGIR
jgi:hypothetical protein